MGIMPLSETLHWGALLGDVDCIAHMSDNMHAQLEDGLVHVDISSCVSFASSYSSQVTNISLHDHVLFAFKTL